VWARWIVYQAGRCEDGAAGAIARRFRREAAETVHGDLMTACYVRGGDPIKVLARIAGDSWAFHQLVFDASLTAFIDEFVTGALAGHADLARQWAGARLGGFQLGESAPNARLQVREPGQESWTEVLDLGARSCAPGGWVIGRLVPSGKDDLLMFDMPPVGVPEAIAREVAAARDGGWWAVVCAAARDGRLSAGRFLREDYELATDVQELDLLRFGTDRRELDRVMRQLRQGRDEISRAAYRVLMRAGRGDLDFADQAYVGAAVQNVRAYDDACRRLVRPGQSDAWSAWAARVPEPARHRLLALSELARLAA
jgi:hypothetical protein